MLENEGDDDGEGDDGNEGGDGDEFAGFEVVATVFFGEESEGSGGWQGLEDDADGALDASEADGG